MLGITCIVKQLSIFPITHSPSPHDLHTQHLVCVHTHTLAHAYTHTHTHTHSLSLSLSLTHTCTHAHTQTQYTQKRNRERLYHFNVDWMTRTMCMKLLKW